MRTSSRASFLRRHVLDSLEVFAHANEVAQQSTCVPGDQGVEDYREPPLAVC